jgi:hypothetical protein
LGFVINVTDNVEGYTVMADSILGGVPGVNGSGSLVVIEFLVVDYGSTNLVINVNGNLSTTLLDSTINSITFTYEDGYFSNKIPGDVDGDKDVDRDDFFAFLDAYGSVPGDPNWDPDCDFDWDGDVDRDDFFIFLDNYGRTL